MDVASGVSSLAPLDFYFQSDVPFFGLHLLVGESSGSINSSGASYVELAFRLRIQVQQVFSFEPSRLERIGTVHAGLFINREERLQRRVNDRLVCKDSHRSSHADTVICTKRGTVCSHPFPILLYICLNSIFLEIKDLVAVLLRHHVHVSLENHTGMVLHSRRGRFTDKDIADFVLKGLQTKRLTVVNKKIRYLFAFAAWTRDLGKAVEAVPQTLRL